MSIEQVVSDQEIALTVAVECESYRELVLDAEASEALHRVVLRDELNGQLYAVDSGLLAEAAFTLAAVLP